MEMEIQNIQEQEMWYSQAFWSWSENRPWTALYIFSGGALPLM